MPSKTVNITGVTRGNDITLKFTIVTTSPLASARFVAKNALDDDDVDAIVNKQVTTALNADGQITEPGDGGDTDAIVEIFLSEADTMAFTAKRRTNWDFEVFDESDKATTPVGGKITFDERVRIESGA